MKERFPHSPGIIHYANTPQNLSQQDLFTHKAHLVRLNQKAVTTVGRSSQGFVLILLQASRPNVVILDLECFP